MIAANATVVKDVPPLAKYIPGKELGMNTYAVSKWGLPLRSATLAEAREESCYRQMLDEWEAARDKARPVYWGDPSFSGARPGSGFSPRSGPDP